MKSNIKYELIKQTSIKCVIGCKFRNVTHSGTADDGQGSLSGSVAATLPLGGESIRYIRRWVSPLSAVFTLLYEFIKFLNLFRTSSLG